MTDVILRISGMDCGACAVRIVRALRGLPGLREVSVSDTAGCARLTYDEAAVDLGEIARCVQRAGFDVPVGTAELMVRYLGEHVDTVTLSALAARFSYHPNYVSTLLRQETGKTFSELLLEQRMDRAAILLKGTDLSVAEVARTLGYLNTSNFHKAFRAHYGMTPRAYCDLACSE